MRETRRRSLAVVARPRGMAGLEPRGGAAREWREAIEVHPSGPGLVLCRWELDPRRVSLVGARRRADRDYLEAMRVSWGEAEPEDDFYIPVFFSARKWYVRLPAQARCCRVELGWRGEGGEFIPLLPSRPCVLLGARPLEPGL